MPVNRLEDLIESINQIVRAGNQPNLKIHKRNELALQLKAYAERLANFGQRYPIVRVTIVDTATETKEYAFYTDITLSDAELLVKKILENREPTAIKTILAENIQLGLKIK